jgi:formate hydrogenlyase subunit 6/NADH:ubiquinone oxidoreductase subunit I
MFDYSDESQKQADAIRANLETKPARKIKTPKVIAVIDQSGCTGCEACIQFCPVDCIELVPGPRYPDMNKMVEVDLDRCIGCKLCAKHCPWDTIHMVPSGESYEKANEWTLLSVIRPDAPPSHRWVEGA